MGRSVGKVKIRSPFSGKNDPVYCFFTVIGARPELIRGFPGFPGFRGFRGFPGNGVRGRKPDPPKHAQES